MNNAKEIRLRFEAGKGGAVGLSVVTALCGDRVGALPRPARRGYAFQGWYTAPEGQAGGRLVESSTVLAEDTPAELTLYAHWAREKQKKSAFLTQKRAVVALILAVVLLIGGLIVTNYIVSLPDPFVDEDGTVYPVRKLDGKYVLYHKGGDPCDRNQDGYYLTTLGTQLAVDEESGACTVYAVVETEGTEIVGVSQRVLAFKQLTYDKSSTTDLTRVIQSILIHNQKGVVDLYRSENASSNRFLVRGHENAALSDELFARLANGCGYTLSIMRLEDPVRLADGSIDYAEYGLAPERRVKLDENGDPVLDEAGQEVMYDYTPTWYTVKTMAPDATTGLDSYTMTIGDAIVSEAGYYARYGDRDVIYVLAASNLDAAVLQPVEALVTPLISYPMTMNTYFSVENFILRTDIDYDKLTLHMAAAYAGILEDERLELDDYENMPQELKDQLKAALLEMEERLSAEDEAFEKEWERLYANAMEACSHKMTAFSYVELDDRSNSLLSSYAYYMVSDYMAGYQPNSNNISSMLQSLYSLSPNAVTVLGPTDEQMEQYGLSEPAFDITYTYIDESGQKHNNHLIFSARTEDGLYYAYGDEYDMIVEVDEGQVPFLGWNEIDWYDSGYFNYNIAHIKDLRLEGQIVGALESKYLDENGNVYIRFDNSRSDQSEGINSEKLVAFVNGEDSSSYTMEIVRATGRKEIMAGTQNIRYFVQSLLTASIEGEVELTDEEMAALRKTDDQDCYLKFTVSLDDGQGTDTSTANLVYRFYRISERKCYLTVESLATPDSPSSPEKAQGRFYVLRSFCDKLVADTVRLQDHEQVYPDTKS